MIQKLMCGLAAAALASTASAQSVLYGVRANGDLLRINPVTGGGYLEGSSGVPCEAAVTVAFYGRFSYGEYVEVVAGPGTLTRLNRWTGAAGSTGSMPGVPPGYQVRGLTALDKRFDSGYALLRPDQQGSSDLLASVQNHIIAVIGPTGQTGLEDVAVNPATGALYAIGPGALYALNTSTGAATLIGGGGYVGDERGLSFLPDGRLVAAGSSLSAINTQTGAATLIGPIGYADIRALAFMDPCYGDCDPAGPPPQLNVNDFVCFQVRFSQGDPSTNCDLSTTPPTLNVNDFICFMNAWISGSGCGF